MHAWQWHSCPDLHHVTPSGFGPKIMRQFGEQLSARSLLGLSSTELRSFRWKLVDKLRPLLLDQLSHIVGDFREALSLKQELVQPFEILLHHYMVGDNPRCIDTLRF
jgi:hypothetical protein